MVGEEHNTMPSVSNSSSIICCTAREPPSPDGLSPRPAISPIKLTRIPRHRPQQYPSNHGSKELFESLSSLGLAEIHSAIPPVDLLDTAGKGLPLVHQDLPANSDDDQDDVLISVDKIKPVRSQISLNGLNLQNVKRNLKKHLSRNSLLLKRRSRSTVGQSEEEIERRAELKRIRHKRIEEELSHGFYETDVESAVLLTPGTTKHEDCRATGSVLSLPSLGDPQPISSSLSLPKSSASSRKQVVSSGFLPMTPTTYDATPRLQKYPWGTISRRHSSPILGDFELSFADPRIYIPSQRRSPRATLPPTPHLKPLRLPSIVEPDRSAWRLSFAAPNRADQLRRLSKEYVEPACSASQVLRQSTSSRKWLHGQGLGPIPDLLTTREIEAPSITSVCQNEHCHIAVHDFGGVDGSGVDGSEDIPAVSQDAYDLSARLESSSINNNLRSQCGSGQSGIKSSEILGDCVVLGVRTSVSQQTKKVPGTSVVSNNTQRSLKRYKFSLTTLFPGTKSRSYSNVLDPLTTTPSRNDYSRRAFTTSSSAFTIRTAIDSNSILASETQSYQEREAELQVVQTRFAVADGKRLPSTPKSSIFTEEFETTEPVEDSKRKSSTFARLTRFATRTYDGTNATEDLLAVPMPDFDIRDHSSGSHGVISPSGDVDDMSAQWGKAVAATQANIKANDARKGSNHGAWKRYSAAGLRRSVWSKDDTSTDTGAPLSAAEEYQKRFQARLAVKEMAMDDWEAEMEASAQKAKSKSKGIMQKLKPVGPGRRFPLSWSRFPSHNRDERSSCAGDSEKIAQHDFAMRTSPTGEKVFHRCRQRGDLHIHDDDPDWHKYDPNELGVVAKIGDVVRQKVYKLEVHGGGSRPFEFQTNGRRGSMTVAGIVGYPELELLAISPGLSEDVEYFEKNVAKISEERQHVVGTPAGHKKELDQTDGSVDQHTHEDSIISIADPRFYEDCLASHILDSLDTSFTMSSRQCGYPQTSRSLTWNGRGKKVGRLRLRRNVSLGDIELRTGTEKILNLIDEYRDDLRDPKHAYEY